jgi:hypothetical protein
VPFDGAQRREQLVPDFPIDHAKDAGVGDRLAPLGKPHGVGQRAHRHLEQADGLLALVRGQRSRRRPALALRCSVNVPVL